MATAAEVAMVRLNINEPTQDPYTDEAIGALVDELGTVQAASAALWRAKAATYATLVDETEAGTSHAFSDMHKNALAMAKAFDANDAVLNPLVPSGPRVRVIERS